jgi:hypothetical protein
MVHSFLPSGVPYRVLVNGDTGAGLVDDRQMRIR